MASIINATTTNGVAVQGDNSGSLQLQTNNGTTAVTIDTSQNVGIGTTSVGTFYGKTVEISNSADCALKFTNAQTGYTSSDGIYVGLLNSGNSDFYLNNRESGAMIFQTSNTERMRIDSSGRVTTPYQPGIGIILVNQVFSASTSGFYKPTTYTTTYDVGGGFNPTGGPSSSFRYTAPVAGRYFIQWSVMGNDGGNRLEVCVLKNGGDFMNGDTNTSKYSNAIVASIQYLAANDYLDFRINQGDYYSGVNSIPCLSIHLIG